MSSFVPETFDTATAVITSLLSENYDPITANNMLDSCRTVVIEDITGRNVILYSLVDIDTLKEESRE